MGPTPFNFVRWQEKHDPLYSGGRRDPQRRNSLVPRSTSQLVVRELSSLSLTAAGSQPVANSLAAIPKCGGKAACFDKPGPHSKYIMSKVAAAQEQADAAAAHGSATNREKIRAVISRHESADWRQRAKADTDTYLIAAEKGILPSFVKIICKKCRDKKPGATHHVLCAGVYFKPDKKARESLLKELRAIATAAKQADAVPRPPRLPTHACLHPKRLPTHACILSVCRRLPDRLWFSQVIT